MSEIEKMYKLANIQPYYKKRIECKEGYSVGQPCGKSPCINCDKSIFEDVMPPFTAEKQIELIKWLIQKYKEIVIEHKLNLFYINIRDIYTGMVHIEFDETIAGLISNLWQSLTEEEKQQIKEILE